MKAQTVLALLIFSITAPALAQTGEAASQGRGCQKQNNRSQELLSSQGEKEAKAKADEAKKVQK